MSKADEFITELEALLRKYSAELEAQVDHSGYEFLSVYIPGEGVIELGGVVMESNIKRSYETYNKKERR